MIFWFDGWGLIKIAKTAKRCVFVLADNDVVGDFDLEQLARPDEIARDQNIGIAWRRISRGVIVCHQNRDCRSHDSQPEYVPWDNMNAIGSSDRYQIMCLDPLAGVQNENRETFPLGVEIGVASVVFFK